jgi:hypothetical protein
MTTARKLRASTAGRIGRKRRRTMRAEVALQRAAGRGGAMLRTPRRIFAPACATHRRKIDSRRERRRADLRVLDKRTAADRIAVCS